MLRRQFLGISFAAIAGGMALRARRSPGVELSPPLEASFLAPTFSVVPVVGDGKWIWTTPPSETGYLEPRTYRLRVGIELEGTGSAQKLKAATAAPVELPEQSIDRVEVEQNGCEAALRRLTDEAGQLVLAAGGIGKGDKISAAAEYRLTLKKAHLGFQKDQFPAKQEFPSPFRKSWCFDSPGIAASAGEVKKLAESLTPSSMHPWDKAQAFYHWVWENIRPRPGEYTSVPAAIRDKVGDCEERAATFVALCRFVGIPARLVWVPNHNWAEFCLSDDKGERRWIPAHTSCYSWFGWTGAHELVLQKGDSLFVPEKRQPQRLLADWLQWQGARPKVRYTAELLPQPASEGSDAGPGARRKNEQGEWKLFGTHPLDPYLRDGARSGAKIPSTGK